MSEVIEIRAEFPAKLRPIFSPNRYKVMHGGRGGGKSWAVARALLLMAADKPLRILCAREIQKSMRDSVHRLLKDQIVALGLTAEFEILDNEIRGPNGAIFLFTDHFGIDGLVERRPAGATVEFGAGIE